MPQVVPITLNNGQEDRVYNPVSLANGQALYADRTESLAANWSKLSAKSEVPTKAKGKGVVRSSLTIPVPVTDQAGCCVDKDSPTVIALNFDVHVPVNASAAQRTAAIALFRSWVNSATFAELVNGESFY